MKMSPACLLLFMALVLSACGEDQTQTAREPEQEPNGSASRSAGNFAMAIADAFPVVAKVMIVAGRIEQGTVSIGDRLCLVPQGKSQISAEVSSIEILRNQVETAKVGDEAAITLRGLDPDQVGRGDHLRKDCEPE